MLRPDLFDSADLKNALSQIMCMSRQSDLEYYETDPVEKAQVLDDKEIDGLLMRRQHLFRLLPSEAEYQRRAATAAAAEAAAASVAESDGRRSQPSAGRSRYLLVNASSALVSSFNHISMRECQLNRGKYVTLTFHVRQPNWIDQLKQEVYVNAKGELDKLIAFMRRLGGEENAAGEISFQDFVTAERDLIYSGRNLRQWAYKFDVELRRDSLMRHAIDAFQCRLGLDGSDNLCYSFGLFLDECLCTNETAPWQVIPDSTPANYKIADRADIFVTNYFAMTANRAFREEVVTVLYDVYVKDTTQQLLQHRQQQRQQPPQQQQQQQQQQRQQRQQRMPCMEFAPTQANTLTHYEKPQPKQRGGAASAAAFASASAAATAAAASAAAAVATVQCRPRQIGGVGVGPVVRIQVPNARKAAATSAAAPDAAGDDDGDTTGANDSSVASTPISSARAGAGARSRMLYVGNS